MLAKADIDRYGGKAAGQDYLSERTKLPILPYKKKEAGAPMDPILAAFRRMKKPVIVRSSSPYEFGDFEGIFTSVRDVMDEAGLVRAVETVEASALSERARRYAEQRGFRIDGRMHSFVQEQSPSAYAGAMLGHPNDRGSVFMTYAGGVSEKHSFFLDHEAGMLIDLELYDFAQMTEEIRPPFDAYNEVKESGLAEGYAIHMEFGLEPFEIYQARPFKPMEIAEFEVPKGKDGLYVHSPFGTLGTTPPDGLAMKMVRTVGAEHAIMEAYSQGRTRLNGGDFDLVMRLRNELELGRSPESVLEWWSKAWDENMEGPYCLVASSANSDDVELDLAAPRMKAVIFGHPATQLSFDVVGHSSIRLLKLARVALYEPRLYETPFFTEAMTGRTVRIISNGRKAVAMLD